LCFLEVKVFVVNEGVSRLGHRAVARSRGGI
jgi:hypothetical protein